MTPHRGLIPLALLLFATGCHSTWYGAQFAPVANEVRVATDDARGQARALVSVRGVRRTDSKTGEAARVELYMRLENLGAVAFHIQQQSLELLSGELIPFASAAIHSEDPPRVEPGAAANLDLYFPMPPGREPDEVDFRALNLRFTIDFEGEVVTTGVQFERRYYEPRSRFVFGSYGVYD